MTEPDSTAAIEQANIGSVNQHPNGPTDPGEMATLASLYYYKDGVFFNERYSGE